jgi:2-methylisocitrate lyase-like PEP mutase family enzyme
MLRDFRTSNSFAKCVKQLRSPVNVVVGLSGSTYSVDDLSKLGVRRISTGGSLARAAIGKMIRAATELKERGTYDHADKAISVSGTADHMKVV